VVDSYRRAMLKRFPYVAAYRVSDDRIVLLAVSNVRRDPIGGVIRRQPNRTDRSESPRRS
jgi:hypothetical protein